MKLARDLTRQIKFELLKRSSLQSLEPDAVSRSKNRETNLVEIYLLRNALDLVHSTTPRRPSCMILLIDAENWMIGQVNSEFHVWFDVFAPLQNAECCLTR
jgi:hypothetical protein